MPRILARLFSLSVNREPLTEQQYRDRTRLIYQAMTTGQECSMVEEGGAVVTVSPVTSAIGSTAA